MRTHGHDDIDPDRRLTCKELAALIGPRRAGRPTDPNTIRDWMLRGLCGVVLWSELDLWIRWTTWRHYQEFVKKVGLAREAERQRLRTAVAAPVARARRTRRALRELEREGAL